jgi:predicted dehydrogenase
MPPVRLITLNPGHFHAALVQKENLPGVEPCVYIYAPLGPDLLAHLTRLAGFNARAEHPTAWEVEVHGSGDPLGRLLEERPGNVVILSGRNRGKIDTILACVEAGLNVLADKPWVIEPDGLPKLEAALSTAARKGVIAYDIMTERHEVTNALQRELVNDLEVFGEPIKGSRDEPGVFMESIHYLMKTVAGVPNRRPAWFFDVAQQGEGLTDVGTHLVDLVPWVLFPDTALDPRKAVEVLAARSWPTVLSRENFQRVTGESDFPGFLARSVQDGRLEYVCNTLVSYLVRGIHVKLNVLWDFEAAAGSGDTHLAVFRGSRSRVEVRQGKEQNFRPELYVVPAGAGQTGPVGTALRHRVDVLQSRFPGIAVEDLRGELRVVIPDRFRVGHEAHFAEVTRHFLGYLRQPASLPAWEMPNMIAKYLATTRGVQMARDEAG